MPWPLSVFLQSDPTVTFEMSRVYTALLIAVILGSFGLIVRMRDKQKAAAIQHEADEKLYDAQMASRDKDLGAVQEEIKGIVDGLQRQRALWKESHDLIGAKVTTMVEAMTEMSAEVRVMASTVANHSQLHEKHFNHSDKKEIHEEAPPRDLVDSKFRTVNAEIKGLDGRIDRLEHPNK